MGIENIVSKASNFISKTGDWMHYGKIMVYATDIEKYALLQDERLVKYFKRIIKEEYKKIKSDDMKNKVSKDFPKYFQNKP